MEATTDNTDGRSNGRRRCRRATCQGYPAGTTKPRRGGDPSTLPYSTGFQSPLCLKKLPAEGRSYHLTGKAICPIPAEPIHHDRYVSEASDQKEADDRGKQNYFEKHYLNPALGTPRKWTPEFGGSPKSKVDVSLPTFIRNKVHHPENSTMKGVDFTDAEFRQSIDSMIALIK